ncbi:uncharacterized protein LOC106064931 [Biomphalaria glabrata]|uniref:Uncharacterized protein LOC106064931 n=1 Tax=Biomphalaria glabrata TaxID=6526 RepID=A0A9W2YJT2_BIOGL|nr:uncharacterized protein LOC106064931 [Biomphalaria glabrata]
MDKDSSIHGKRGAALPTISPSLSSSNASNERMKVRKKTSTPSAIRLTNKKRTSIEDFKPFHDFKVNKGERRSVRVIEEIERKKYKKLLVEMKKFDKMDETSKVLVSKPRALEEGRDIKTQHDMATQEHHRLLHELKMKKMANEVRQTALLKKKALLQQTIQMFDSFIRDVDKKYSRARFQIERNRIEMEQMEKQKIKMLHIIESLSKVRRKRDSLDCSNPILKFMRFAFTASNFRKAPSEMINRFHAMKNNLQSLLTQYEADLELQEQLVNEEHELVRQTQFKVIEMRNQIIQLKEELLEIQRMNHQLSSETFHMTDSVKQDYIEIYTIKASINNLATMLSNFRHFTSWRMSRIGKNWRRQIEEVGSLIVFYKELIDSFKISHPVASKMERIVSPDIPDVTFDTEARGSTTSSGPKSSLYSWLYS